MLQFTELVSSSHRAKRRWPARVLAPKYKYLLDNPYITDDDTPSVA